MMGGARHRRWRWWPLLACLAGVVAVHAVHAGHDEEEPVNLIPADQVKRLMDIGEKIAFFDLRDAAAFAQGHLPQARSLPIAELDRRWGEIPKAGRVVLYCPCPGGRRDESYAYLLLRKERYRNITFLDGGYTEWTKRGYPVQAGAH